MHSIKRDKERGLRLHEWELIFSYSTYLPSPVPNLEAAARRLVQSGLGYAAVTSGGSCVWREGNDLEAGTISIDIQDATTRATIQLPEVGFDLVRRELLRAASLRYSEIKLFGRDSSLPVPYLRLSVMPCTLSDVPTDADEESVSRALFHPSVKVYETGDIVVSLKYVPDANSVDVEAFIEHDLKIRRDDFDLMVVPTRLAQAQARIYEAAIPSRTWLGRWQKMKRLNRFDASLERNAMELEFEGNKFMFAPLGLETEYEKRVSTPELALALVAGVFHDLGNSREGWKAVFLGDRLQLPRDAFWTGRPHIHIVRHSDQRYTASQNERVHGAAYARILAEIPEVPDNIARQFLPKNMRPLGDYALYTNGATILWVWARTGLDREQQLPWSANNPGQFVDEHEIQAELLEYGHIVHRRLAAEARDAVETDSILRAQERLLEWEGAMREAGHYGEIREFLSEAWGLTGVDQLRDRITRNLQIQQTRTTLRDAAREARWEQAITVLFGLLAVPSLANEVLRPFWLFLHLPRPAAAETFTLTLLLVALVIIGLCLVGLRVLGTRRRH